MNAQNSVRKRVTTLLASATAGLLALGGLVAAPSAAFAADSTIEGGTLNWGVTQSWRNYVTGFIASGTVTAEAPAVAQTNHTVTWAAGSGKVDLATGTGSVTYKGTMVSKGHQEKDSDHFGLNQRLVDPQIVFSSPTKATLSYEVTQEAFGRGFAEFNGERVVIADLAIPAGALASGKTVEAAATFAATSAPVYGNDGNYKVGSETDPVVFTLPVFVPEVTQTSTVVSASKASVLNGEAVDLTATVTPAEAVGNVVFKNNGAELAGGTVAVSGGVATLANVKLPLGANAVSASFVPADAQLFEASQSAQSVTVQVNKVPAVATTTELANIAPSSRALLGGKVALSAQVAAANESPVAGKVEFYGIADGATEETLLGSGDVDGSGKATFQTTELAAGGHKFVAKFVPADAEKLTASESKSSENYGVVDTAAPAPYVPGADAQTSTGATASWSWSNVVWEGGDDFGWKKFVTGDISVDAKNNVFDFANGTVTADAGGAVINFAGSLRVSAYSWYGPAKPDGFWMELIDPALHLNADGTGVWVAGVNSGAVNYVADDAAERIVVGTVAGYTGGHFGVNGQRDVQLGYTDTTARGTWAAGRTAAWPNAFVLQAPAMGQMKLEGFFFESGGKTDPDKAPSPLSVNFDWPAVSSTQLLVGPAATAAKGAEVTLTAQVAPAAAAGKVEFFATAEAKGAEQKLGEATVENGAAVLKTKSLAAGGNNFRAVFTSSNGYAHSSTATEAAYRVVDSAQPKVCAPADGIELSGVAASWAWNDYSKGWKKVAGGNIALSADQQSFDLSEGIATIADNCATLSFTGSMRVEAYGSSDAPHGFWVELVNPELAIDANGHGAWTAAVRTGAGVLNEDSSERIVVAEIANAVFPDFTKNTVDGAASLRWDDVTARGTWSPGQTASWSNVFVQAVNAPSRAFYYASGSGKDAAKAPAPVSYSWTWAPAAASVAVNGDVSGKATVKQGEEITFVAGPFAERGADVAVEVHSDPVSLGSVKADPLTGMAQVSWKVPADFEVGEHEVIFTQGDESFKTSFTIAKAAAPDTDNGNGEITDGKGNSANKTEADKVATTGGADFGGLIGLGAFTLLAGAVTVVIARRRAAAQQ